MTDTSFNNIVDPHGINKVIEEVKAKPVKKKKPRKRSSNKPWHHQKELLAFGAKTITIEDLHEVVEDLLR